MDKIEMVEQSDSLFSYSRCLNSQNCRFARKKYQNKRAKRFLLVSSSLIYFSRYIHGTNRSVRWYRRIHQGFSISPYYCRSGGFLLSNILLDRKSALMVAMLMEKLIVSVDSGNNNFRICLPRKIIKFLSWENVRYVIVSTHPPDEIVIKRLVNDEIDNG